MDQQPSRERFSKTKIAGFILIGLVAVTVSGFFIYKVNNSRHNPTFPTAIKHQAGFVLFYPTDKSILKVDKSTIKFDASNKLVSYITYNSSNSKIIISEQATPETFVDIPTAYDQLIERLQGYSTFESANGKVSLTHPKELKGPQSAVMNSKGTLMFVRPSVNMSDSDWRLLFNSLQPLSESK